MNKKLLALLVVSCIFFAALPAFAAVQVENQTPDTIRLEIRTQQGVELGMFHLRPGDSMPAGGTNKTITMNVKTADGRSQLASGTFNNGDRVVIQKNGGSYSIRKK